MANSKEIGKWLIANSEKLNLKVDKLSWTEKWLPGLQHFHVEISLDGIIGSGSGIDKSSDMAFVKAGVEAIERAICFENKKRSNGIAGHIKDDLAKRNAKYELLERDTFLSHYLTKTPFVCVEKELEKNTMYQNMIEKLKPLGVNFEVFGMKAPNNYFGHFCLCTPLTEKYAFSSIIGLGLSDTKEKSLNKSLLECFPNVIWHLVYEEESPSMGKGDFEQKDEYSPRDHKSLFLGPSYQREIKEIFNNVTKDQSYNKLDAHIEYRKLFSSSDILKTCPVKIYQAISDDVQSAFYGPTQMSKLNLKRLMEFSGKDQLTTNDINMIPHCLG